MHTKFAPSVLVVVSLLGLWSGGCASRQPSQMTLKAGEYQKILQKQKAGVPIEDETRQEFPEMTAGEYEVLGDTYLRQGNLTMAFV